MKLFRYEDRVYSTCEISPSGSERYGTTPVRLECHEFEVIKETPCGFWIDWIFSKKWVSKTSRKRFAYPTKEQAKASFRIRKERQIQIHQTIINRANEALALLNHPAYA